MLSLFTGAGGLDIGLERAGLSTIAALETDEDAKAVLRDNRPGWRLVGDGNVETADRWLTPRGLGLEVGELEVLAGGPPCQPFSKAAQWSSSARGGMMDRRSACVYGMLSLLETFLPHALLIENVSGFLNGRGSAGPLIKERLRGINARHGTHYQLASSVVDAADHGIPQHRRRAIAIAYRDDGLEPRLPEPTHSDAPVRAWDVLADLSSDEKPEPHGRWAGLLPSVPEGRNYLYLTARGGGEELFGWRTRFWSFLLKLAKDRPSWTLPASPGPSTGPFHWENRPLSVWEQMRLQSFPDEWHIDRPFRVGRRLVGNATPPLLAELLGRCLVRDLGLGTPEARSRTLLERPTLLWSHRTDVPPPCPPLPVPTEFREHIGSHEAHPGEGLGPAPRAPRVTGETARTSA
ncbi:DNA cytosine methyltransferase [Haloactinospora alba]|uniref:DNA cytosine methyltransferase n=1 Tax=Haloactinospora alba TaxID=405555 RepID=UPI0011531D89